MVSLEACLASWANGAEPNITYRGSGAFLARSGACKFVQGPGDAAAHPVAAAVSPACRKAGQSLCFCKILQGDPLAWFRSASLASGGL